MRVLEASRSLAQKEAHWREESQVRNDSRTNADHDGCSASITRCEYIIGIVLDSKIPQSRVVYVYYDNWHRGSARLYVCGSGCSSCLANHSDQPHNMQRSLHISGSGWFIALLGKVVRTCLVWADWWDESCSRQPNARHSVLPTRWTTSLGTKRTKHYPFTMGPFLCGLINEGDDPKDIAPHPNPPLSNPRILTLTIQIILSN